MCIKEGQKSGLENEKYKTDSYVQGGGAPGGVTDLTRGCTFRYYHAITDAGLVAMIQVESHSMFGYGYDDFGNIILHDTRDGLEHTMP
jgi:hypothetical protein